MSKPPGLRERYALYGPRHFGTVELLTLVLGTGSKGRSAQSIASTMVETFGSLSQLREAPVQSLASVSGVGPARAVRIHAALQLSQRARARPPATKIDRPQAIVDFLRPHLDTEPVETFWVVCLDDRLRTVGCHPISRGSRRCTVVDPVEVYRRAILLRSSAVVVAHNHPSGDPSPSREDRSLTARLGQCGQMLGIPLLDHIIFGADGHWSFADHGSLPGRVDLRSFTGAAEHRASLRRP